MYFLSAQCNTATYTDLRGCFQMIQFEITKKIPDLSVVKHYSCMVIRTIYLFLVYCVCLNHLYTVRHTVFSIYTVTFFEQG